MLKMINGAADKIALIGFYLALVCARLCDFKTIS